MNPPRGGPKIGPINAGIVRSASALTISLFETVLRMIRRPTGTIMAPPMPWSARAAINPSSEVESPQAIEPSVNTAMAARNTLRAPKRSAHQPLTGMKTVSARR